MATVNPPSGHVLGLSPRAARAAILLVAFYLYVLLRIDPALIYYGRWLAAPFPRFVADEAYLRAALARPGGLVDWASAFLCQLYHLSWLGAAVITGLAALLSLSAAGCLRALTGRRPRLLHLAPAFLLLLSYNQAGNPLPTALAAALGLSMAHAFAGACVRGPTARRRVGATAPAAACGVLLYFAGGGAFLLFAAVCCVLSLGARRWARAAFWPVWGAAVPYLVAVWLMGGYARDAYSAALPFGSDASGVTLALELTLWAWVPAVSLLLLAARVVWTPRADGGGPSRGRRLAEMAAVAVVLAAGAVAAGVTFRATAYRLLRIEYWAERRGWPQLLAEASRLPPGRHDICMTWDVNRALYHTGQLLDRMFEYPQRSRGLFPLLTDFNVEGTGRSELPRAAYVKCAEVLYELGRVNESETIASEAWVMVGEHPPVMRRLALIYETKQQPASAALFLGAMSKDLVYGPWARRRFRELAGGRPAPEAELARGRMTVKDEVGSLPLDLMLLHLLNHDPSNRMAYDYLMAHYLLTKRLDGVAMHAPGLAQMGYDRVPAAVEDALVLHSMLTGRPMAAGRLTVSAEAQRRAWSFQSALDRHGGDQQAAWRDMPDELRTTYLFYFQFYQPTGGPA